MFVLLYVNWFILNSRVDMETALVGLPICLLLYLFSVKFIGIRPKEEWRLCKKLGMLLRYLVFLVWEIVKANIGVLRLILNPSLVPESSVAEIHTDLQGEAAKTLYADSITLTPGTITIDVTGNTIKVHCLDKEMADGLIDNEMEKRLLVLERSGNNGNDAKRA